MGLIQGDVDVKGRAGAMQVDKRDLEAEEEAAVWKQA